MPQLLPDFNRRERWGLISIIVLIIIIMSISFFIRNKKVENSIFNTKYLDSLWVIAQHQNSKLDSNISPLNTSQTTLFPFDPNTLDSVGFTKLGLQVSTVKSLLNWRNKGKVFYKKEDLKPLYGLSAEMYQKLEPFISIKNNTPIYLDDRFVNNKITIPEFVDLNTVDSITLVLLKGIGPFYAHKIIDYRQKLGAYTRLSQIKEIIKLPDSTYHYLEQKVKISTHKIKLLNINTVSEQTLSNHPYIGASMANNIIKYRNAIGKFENLSQLRQVPLMNEEKYRKIAEYFNIQ